VAQPTQAARSLDRGFQSDLSASYGMHTMGRLAAGIIQTMSAPQPVRTVRKEGEGCRFTCA
jgi:hypothetical protein